MRADTKENTGIFIQQSEKETLALNCKGLKEDLKKKENEILGMKNHMIEYEREIAKLREKLKYMRESGTKPSISMNDSSSDQANWKETCMV
jgi:hypothetical protein